MAEILLPTIEGPHVRDSKPLAVLGKAMAPVALAVLVTERLYLTETMMTMDSAPRIEGVHVTDARPLVALGGAVVAAPLAVLVTERLRIKSPHRVRRVNNPR